MLIHASWLPQHQCRVYSSRCPHHSSWPAAWFRCSHIVRPKMGCVKRANKVLGMIARNFEYKSRDIILPLYKKLGEASSWVGVQFWPPNLWRHLDKMERVQRQATKMVQELRGSEYDTWLSCHGLITLEKRLLRGQVIETFKCVNGFNNTDPSDLFPRNPNPRARLDNSRRLLQTRGRIRLAEQFFSFHIAGTWNALPADVIQAPSVNSFKASLDAHWGD